MADQKDIGKDLEQSLKDSKRLQGDQNVELNKTINLLSKINDLRDESIAKVKSLSRETINVKDIEKEVQKIKQKNKLAAEKLNDLEGKLATDAKKNAEKYIQQIQQKSELEKEFEKARTLNNRGQMNFLRNQMSLLDAELVTKENTLGVDERQYAALLQSKKVTEENLALIQDELATEKEIDKHIGFTGKTMGLFANKLGIGKKYYAEMVEKAKDLNDEGKKLSFGDKLGGLAKAAGGGIMEALTDPLTLIPLVGGAIAGVAKGIKSVFDYIVGIQDKTVKFARAMNMSTEAARQLKMQFADINVANGDLFVNTQKLVESQMEFVELFGTTNKLSNEILATNIKLKDIAGLEADVRQGLAESATITGQSMEKTTKSVLAQVVGLKNATGIQFQNQKILKEVANLGGYLGLQFAKYPEKLTKSLLTVKAMGMELKQLDAIADSFLDFESSISKEFEAQLLTGKDINLAKARELFLNNDLAGAAAEINKQVGSTADFMKMNRFEQESLANAMGMSRDQMGDMLRKQEMLSKLGAKDTDNAREQLRLGLEKYKNQKALSAAIGEENYQSLVNASLQEKIAAFIEKIKQSISDFVEKTGIIDKIEGMMNWLSQPENIRSAVMMVRDVFASIVSVVGTVVGGIMRFLNIFPGINIDPSMIEMVEGAGAKVRSMGGDLSSIAAKEKAGTGGSSARNSGGESTGSSTRFGSPSTVVTVKMREREMFDVAWVGYQEGAQFDQQMSQKNNTNPTQ